VVRGNGFGGVVEPDSTEGEPGSFKHIRVLALRKIADRCLLPGAAEHDEHRGTFVLENAGF
jgi:hypothetical protein